MDRRKFIAGLGSLTAAGAAGIGTGAFSSVEAERSVSINAAGDANAYLSLSKVTGSPNSQKYVTKSNGEVGFDFSGSNGSSNLGDGFNTGAVTQVNDLLQVANQGTQDVEFWVEVPYSNNVDDYVTLTADGDASSTGLIGDASGSGADKVTLSPGDSITLDLEVDADPGMSNYGPFGQTVTFHADATSSGSS